MPMQSQNFSFPPIWSGSHFSNSRNPYFTTLWFKVLYKRWFKVLYKMWFKASQASLQQGTCVLDCGPTLQVNGSVRLKSGGYWSRSTGSPSPRRLFLYQITRAWNFGHKDQVVFDHRDRKKQFLLYVHTLNAHCRKFFRTFNFCHLSNWRKIFKGENFPIYGI